jgi:hypothetical protein
MVGQRSFFAMRSKTKPAEAIERFTAEVARLFEVMEGAWARPRTLSATTTRSPTSPATPARSPPRL